MEGPFIERQTRADHCFACGPANPRGLHLAFQRIDDHTVGAQTTLDPEFAGWPGVAHGGVVSLLVDEATSWCVAACAGVLDFATRELTLRFFRPTPVGRPITVTGRILSREGIRFFLDGEVRLEDGTITARGRVEIVQLEGRRSERFRAAVGG